MRISGMADPKAGKRMEDEAVDGRTWARRRGQPGDPDVLRT